MTACNQRPPEGHPFHGTLVACHLHAGHKDDGIPHSWEIPDDPADLLVTGLRQVVAALDHASSLDDRQARLLANLRRTLAEWDEEDPRLAGY